jgi:very-short-patch-repair endonuclease
MRTIALCQNQEYFTDGEYLSVQNKAIKIKLVSLSGAKWLFTKRAFNTKDRYKDAANIIKELGGDAEFVAYQRDSGEDNFYAMLTRFFPSLDIQREYRVLGYRVDFYISDYFLMVEYDEGGHRGVKHKESDRVRDGNIKKYILDNEDSEQVIIRVADGMDIEGLAKIVGFIALNSPSATEITKAYEDI